MPRRFDLVALVVLDGWGCAPPGPGNAVALAETPNFDRLWHDFPHTTLDASGDFALHNPDVPDTAVGYRESLVRRYFSETGLTIMEPIHPGFTKLQDAIVATG